MGKCFDMENPLYVTANTSGYYLNKGPSDDKSGQLDYDRPDGETHRDLVTLIKSKSPKFAEMIEKQEFTVKQQQETGIEHLAVHSKDDDVDGEQTFRSEHQANWQQKEQQQDKERKQKTQTKTRLEPSLKWKALGLEEDQMSRQSQQMKTKKKSSVIVDQRKKT